MRHFILFIFVWLHLAIAFAAPSSSDHKAIGKDSVILLPPLADNIAINHGVHYLFETNPINFEKVAALPSSKWTRYSGQLINFKTQRSPVWLKFVVYNSMENSGDWLLKFLWPHLDHIEIYIYHHKEKKWDAPLISGLAVPMQLRPAAHRNFLFPLTINSGEKATIYVRAISKTKLILPMTLWKEDVFAEQDAHHIILLGLYFGVLSAMFLTNFSIFVFTRDKGYFFLSFYVLAILFYTLLSTGVGTQYLWDKSYWIKSHFYGIIPSLCFVTGILFAREFLSLRKYRGWAYSINKYLLVFWIFSTFLHILGMTPFLITFEEIAAIISNTALLITGIYLWTKDNIPARYYTIALSSLLTGTFLVHFGLMDIIKYTWISSYGQMAGFAMELVLLSFALANQINRERIAREEAQQMTLMLTKRISKELEQRVQERTIDLKNAMLRLKKVNKELSELTITDPLTKVYNRRFFDKALANEVKRANRTLQPIAVVMVDIDHFKMINDNHGHPVGDKCLFLVAQALRQQTSRSGDLVARYGGEEFILILTATSEEKALLLAEKVRDAVEKLVINNNGNPIQLRVSVGVAAWVPRQGESHHQLVKAADNALYQAKRNGRNQVVAISA